MDPYGDPEYPHNLTNAVYVSFPVYLEESVNTFLVMLITIRQITRQTQKTNRLKSRQVGRPADRQVGGRRVIKIIILFHFEACLSGGHYRDCYPGTTVFKTSYQNSFKERVPVNFIHSYPVFKRVDVAW